MNRRRFVELGAMAAAARLCAQEEKKAPKDEVVASATRDITPRVGIVLSSFQGSADHDGTAVAGLKSPCPVDAELAPAQADAMLRKALELGCRGHGELSTLVAADEWVVVKLAAAGCAQSTSDILLVRALLGYLTERKSGAKFTLAVAPVNPKYADELKTLTAEFAARFSGLEFEVDPLDPAKAVELPVAGEPGRTCRVAKCLEACDKLISVAPLATDPELGVALGLANYLDFGAGATGRRERAMLDLFGYHPADYAILGGRYCWEGEGACAAGSAPLRHNLVIASPNAVAADTVAAQVMGFEPARLAFLEAADKKGYGTRDPDAIWMRGNDLEEARRSFRKPARFAGLS